MVLILGPWSDRAGRKVLVLMPLFGFMIYDMIFMINAIFYKQLKVEFLMLEFLQDWFGGSATIFMGWYVTYTLAMKYIIGISVLIQL